MDRIELLAPAGDYNCFLAAINAGADAVYLSGEKFGARAYAKNFSEDELIKAIDYAHIFNRKIFLTVNTLLKDKEMEELYDYLLPFYRAGLDGVIVQDIGVISYIRKCFPDLPVHASTQLAITGLEGIKLLDKLGVKRTVLAREVSLAEIEYIHNNSNMEIETFVHGALCYSYSGKCLFSSLVGGRSGNRGRCAGSCRQPYNDDQYILSTKDICCLSIIPDLIEAGICSLKIEGRMKSPEYVYGVTSIYRKYIDIYYKNNSLNKEEIKNRYFTGKLFNKDNETLTRLYTRGGNSKGYYYKHNDRKMISLDDASYKSYKSDEKLSLNDKNDDCKIKIKGYLYAYPNEKLSLTINDSFIYEGCAVSTAQNRPLDVETVVKQLNKTKDTEFEFCNIDCNIADDAFVRISDLNELRREAINLYRNSLLSEFRRATPEIKEGSAIVDEFAMAEEIQLKCEISNVEQLKAISEINDIYGVYVPYNVLRENIEIVQKLKEKKTEVYIKFQSVIRYNFLEKNKTAIISVLNDADGVLVDSHEVLEFLNDIGYSGKVIGDIHMYALNKEAYIKYKMLGVDNTTVPIELNKKELYQRDIKGEELIVYGHLPMMISAQCVNNTLNSCDKTSKRIILKDRKGAEFICINNCSDCSNIIYNNVPISLQGESDFINKISPKALRLVFSVENADDISPVVNYFLHFVKSKKMPEGQLLKDNQFTKGHLNRGVL